MKMHWERLADIWWIFIIFFIIWIPLLVLAIRHELNKKKEREAAGIRRVRLATATKLKIIAWTVVGISCVFLFFGGIVSLAASLANTPQADYNTKRCTTCEGDGRFLEKTCSICDGKGYIITNNTDFGPALGVIGIIVGPIGYFVGLSQTKRLKEEQWSAPKFENKQPKYSYAAKPASYVVNKPPVQAEPRQKPAADSPLTAELKEYKELLDLGVITQEEFDAKKKQLLGL